MYIDRHIERIVKESLSQFPVVLVTGPRQVGKTTMLRVVGEGFSYVTFDDPIMLQEASSEESLFLRNNKWPLLIDEVQYAPNILRFLKMAVDEKQEKGMYLLTGSQAFELMAGVSETLAGRMAILEMQGLSMREKLGVTFNKVFLPTQEYIDGREEGIVPYTDLWSEIFRGTMPALADANVDWERYYGSYVKTYIEKDVRQIINVTDELKFMRFMTSLAARCGELLNYQAIATEAEVSIDTIKRWLSILSTSGIIRLVEPYANNLIKRVVKTPKVYFMDTGLVCYLTRWTSPEALRLGAAAGSIFENFVVSEIMKSFLNAGKSLASIYFYRDRDQREIDLVIEENGVLYPIEIKMSAKPTKAMAKNFNVLDIVSDKKRGLGVILCQYERKTYLSEEVVALPVEYI